MTAYRWDLLFLLVQPKKTQKVPCFSQTLGLIKTSMLFKHINQVQVAMSPFNVSSRSARYVFTAKSGYESSGWLVPWPNSN
jgi:hypothetical protein